MSIIETSSAKRKREEDEKVDRKKFKNGLDIARKPKGTIGRKTTLLTNCCRVMLDKRQIYQYEISIRFGRGTPRSKELKLKRDIFWKFMMNYADETFQIKLNQVVFDDEHQTLFTTKNLDGGSDWMPSECREYIYLYDGVYGQFDTTILITFNQEIEFGNNTLGSMGLIQDILNSVITQHSRIPEGCQEARQWFAKRTNMIPLYLPDGYEPLKVSLNAKLFRGLSVEVKPSIEGRSFYLNLGVTHPILVDMDLPVIRALHALSKKGQGFNANKSKKTIVEEGVSLNKSQVAKFNACFKGLEIETTYEPIRRYIIESLTMPKSGTGTDDAEETMAVKEYYRSKHGIELQFPHMHLKMRNTGIHIPMELCKISPDPQQVRKEFHPEIAQKICRKAAIPPQSYFRTASSMSNQALFKNDDALSVMNAFGVRPVTDVDGFVPIQIDARVLPPPRCRFESQHPLHQKVLGRATDSYLIVCAANIQSFESSSEFVKRFMSIASEMDLRFVNSPDVRRLSQEFKSLDGVRDFIMKESSNILDNRFDKNRHKVLFLFILRSSTDPLYNWIKKCGDIECGMATQCVNVKELEKHHKKPNKDGADQMCRNLVAKINTRLGGVMNEISEDCVNPCNRAFLKYTTDSEPTLFLGVIHAKPLATRKLKTIISMSFNRNVQSSEFNGVYGFAEGTDLLHEIDTLFYDVLEGFHKSIGRIPSKVFIIRGGLSESNAQRVAEFEVYKFKDAWTRFSGTNPGSNPSILYLTVERNHKIRFMKESEYSRPQFLNRRGYGIRNDLNMEKGTVVDDSFINSPSGNGFYLCSHKGRIGTIKPSYYETRFNEWNIAPEQLPNDLQSVIFSLCYMLQRSVKTPSQPAPVFYARLLAERVSKYLETTKDMNSLHPHMNMKDTTYFT